MKILMVLIAVTLVGGPACVAQEAKYSFKENFVLNSPSQVSVSSSDGNIEVVAIPGTSTDVFYIVRKNNKLVNITREQLEKEVHLDVKHEGNNLTITVKYKDEFNLMDWKDKLIIDFRIQVPPATSCNLHTSDGNLKITGLTRDQELNTSDGNVDIDDIMGNVKATTSDGNITVEKVSGKVEVKSSDGNITMSDVRGDANAGTSDGNISLTMVSGTTFLKTSDGDIKFKDLSGSLTARTSDGNVSGNLLKLTKELTVKTSDGNISIGIPAKLGLDLDIKGESLDVPLSNFSGKSDDNSIEGKINGGGIVVNLSTSGNVSLSYK
ncbi:MAG: DUF4097 family beta strand repeat-containing protein [Chryseolinea sp.]